jgi:uncharacterized protein YkwD
MNKRARATLTVGVAVAALVFGCARTEAPPAPTAYYHDDAPAVRLTDDERALVLAAKETFAALGRPAPELDHALVVAARGLAAVVRERGPADAGKMRNETVAQALLDAGVTDARFASSIAGALDRRSLAKSLDAALRAQPAADPYSHFGIGVVRSGLPPVRVMVLLLTERIAALEPLPKFVDGEAYLRGRIEPGYGRFAVLVTRPDGRTVTLHPAMDERREFVLALPLDPAAKGRYTVEVEAEGAGGPEIASLFPLDYRERPLAGTFVASTAASRLPARVEVEDEPLLSEAEAAARVVGWINEERARRGLIPLAVHPALASLARAHCRDMDAGGYVRHVSPTAGDLAARADAAGLAYHKIGENIALNSSVRAAHASLMESPAHRENLLDPAFRFVGVGVVRRLGATGQPEYVITEEFADEVGGRATARSDERPAGPRVSPGD